MAEGPTALITAPSSDSESEPMLKPRSRNSPEQPGEEQREMIELQPVPAPEQAPQPPLSSGPGSQPTPGSSIQQGETPQEYPTPLATATTTATSPSSDSESEPTPGRSNQQGERAQDTDDDDPEVWSWKMYFESSKQCLITLYTGHNFVVGDRVENTSIWGAPWPKAWDDLRMKVERNAHNEIISQEQAGLNIFIDGLVEIKKGDPDEVLLLVTMMKKEDITLRNKNRDIMYQVHIRLPYMVNTLIERGADPLARDNNNDTPLYHAVRSKPLVVVKILLKHMAPWTDLSKERNELYKRAIMASIDFSNDGICELLFSQIPATNIIPLVCEADENNKLFRKILQDATNMQKTMLKVLDCLIDIEFGSHICVDVEILEIDEKGREPDDDDFDHSSKTPFHIIAENGNEDIVCHDAVRILVEWKWNNFARRRVLVYTFLYEFAWFCITISAIGAALTKDATEYSSGLDIARAVFEVISMFSVFVTLFEEFIQLRRNRLEYFQNIYNWLDFSSSMLLLSVPVLRFTLTNAEWYVFALGYVLWTIRIFEYAFLFSQMGVYVQTLELIIKRDLVQFGSLFFVILLAFSVSFFLTLKGDGDLDKHAETSTLWDILFIGIRSLIEAAAVVEYTGPDGYGTGSAIVMVTFLFICIVVLLNILIAQLSNSYQTVNAEAQRGLEVARAKLVARLELHGWFMKGLRRTHYNRFQYIHKVDEVKRILQKSKTPSLNEMNKSIRDIGESLEKHFQDRMTQENTLKDIRNQLEEHKNTSQKVMTRLFEQDNVLQDLRRKLCPTSDKDRRRSF